MFKEVDWYSLKDANDVKKDKKFKDGRGWDVIYDGTYIRDYKKVEVKEGEEKCPREAIWRNMCDV